MSYNNKLTLLSDRQIWGNYDKYPLEVINKYGKTAAITDLCVLTGGYLCENTDYSIYKDGSLKGRTGWFWTSSDNYDNNVFIVLKDGSRDNACRYRRNGAIRPALKSSLIFSQIFPNRFRGYNETEEVEFGEYPQYAADYRMQNILDQEFKKGMNKTGRSYTFDSVRYDEYDKKFNPITYDEYEYQGKKYIRVKANSDFSGREFKLSNGVEYKDGDYVWVEVTPVLWLIDDKSGLLISKRGLVSGIRFLDKDTKYKGDFSKTEMNEYLNKFMLRDITQSITLNNQEKINSNINIGNDTSFEKLINRIEKLSVDNKNKVLDYLLDEFYKTDQNKIKENKQTLQKIKKMINE